MTDGNEAEVGDHRATASIAPAPAERVSAASAPVTVSLDPLERARRRIAYTLLALLGGIIVISAVLLSVTLIWQIADGAHFVLEWIGIVLAPVAALAGSAVTFYMERAGR